MPLDFRSSRQGVRRVYRFAGHLMPLAPSADKYVSLESLGRYSLTGGGYLFRPCLRACSHSGAQSPALFQHTRRSCSSVCANALPLVARLRFPASYSVAGCALATSALLIAARPSLSNRCGVRAPLWSRSPRHAATLRAEWGSMSRKGARVFSACRGGISEAADVTPSDGVRSPYGG